MTLVLSHHPVLHCSITPLLRVWKLLRIKSSCIAKPSNQRCFQMMLLNGASVIGTPRNIPDVIPDVIITVGPASLRYMIESHRSLFPGTPIVFCGTTREMLQHLQLDADFTGVFGVPQPEYTLLAALKLQPRTRHVFVTGGMGSFDRDWEARAKESFRNYESKLEFTYLTELDMPSLLERLKHLPRDSIVYHTAMTQDAAGSRFIDSAQSVPLIVSAANAPIYVTDDVDLGRGTVGGYLIRWEADGLAAGTIAARILNGAKPQNIPIVSNNNAYMFDWRAMRRWRLKEENLPPGSIILLPGVIGMGAHKVVLDRRPVYHSQPLRSCDLPAIRPETTKNR